MNFFNLKELKQKASGSKQDQCQAQVCGLPPPTRRQAQSPWGLAT